MNASAANPIASGRGPTPPPGAPSPRMSLRNRILFLAVAWLIVLMPFLFWHGTWFGRPLSDRQINDYLHDTAHPRHTQHALVQIGERMSRHEASVILWYPDLVRLAGSPIEEIRNTDAWVMGQDPTRPEFHETLLRMLHDSSPLVRGNAALALVRFGDPSGHDQIVSLLQSDRVTAPSNGTLMNVVKPGTAIHQKGLVAKLKTDNGVLELRAQAGGNVRAVPVTAGSNVTAGTEIATIDPPGGQVWEALRALSLIGRTEDLPVVQYFERVSADWPQRISQQAKLTEEAIRERAGK
ncbi:MAG: biotin/lipoyl-containing protein [Terriglobales bacterium]